MPSKVDAALAWAARGFRVFPLPPNGTRPSAEWKGWPEHATDDLDKVRAWFEGTDCNIAVCTTGLLVVDIDSKKGRAGFASLEALGGGPDTLTVRTKSGGLHLYYWGADVANSAGELGEGLDIRSHNGYAVAPGSVVDGLAYEVLRDVPMARAPQHIVARCRPPGQRAENALVPLVDLDSPAAVQAATERVARTPGAVQGEQSEAAYKLACAVRDLGISETTCAVILLDWAGRCSPVIMPDDLAGRVANAYAYAQNAPGAKHPEVLFGAVDIPPVPTPPPLLPATTTFGNAIAMADLAPRPHVIRGVLARGEVTVLLAPGGVGKSLLILYTAVHLALGIDYLGNKNMVGRAKSVIYNAEDTLAEMSMRLHALCTTMGVSFNDVQPYIHLISGKRNREAGTPGTRIRVVNGPQPARNDEAVSAMIELCRDPDVVFAGMDPLNKLHSCNGNDNIAMSFVMDVFEFIAEESDVAVMLSHHVSKPGIGRRAAGNADVSQGAAAVVNGARTVLTLGTPEDEDAARYALRPADRATLLRLDGAKANRAVLGSDPIWLRKVGVSLWNGEEVGSVEQVHDIRGRRDDMFKMIAQAAANTIHASQKGDMSLTDLASAIAPHNEFLRDSGPDVVKGNMQSMDGKRIPVVVNGKAATFVVFRQNSSYRARIE